MEDSKLTKITAKLYPPLYADFDKRVGDLLLRRDAFLERLIATEIPHLQHDLDGKRLSDEANRHISRCLKQFGGKSAPPLRQVSISVRSETAEDLRTAVKTHNLVRDAFLNRLLLFFRSSATFLDAIELPEKLHEGNPYWLEDRQTSPIERIEGVFDDPFYHLRIACQHEYGCGLYLMTLPDDLIGLSCFLEDDQVPGTIAHTKREEEEARMQALIEAFEQKLTQDKIKGRKK